MTRRVTIYLAGVLLLVTVLGCSNASGGPSVSARATSLAQTAAALLTGTAAASFTPETPTLPPSATPTAPSVPTVTTTATRRPITATPVPSETPTPCSNNKAEFVSDVNVPDGTHFAAGATFKKTWQLRNTGDCPWTTTYTLRNVGGEVMGGATINLPNGVPPGATVELTVSFVAPTSPGAHVSHWQMFAPDGTAFGTKPYVAIRVP